MNAKYFIVDEGWRLTADKTAYLFNPLTLQLPQVIDM